MHGNHHQGGRAIRHRGNPRLWRTINSIAVALALCSPVLADSNFSLEAGPGLTAFPRYPGARAQHIWPIPAIDARYGSLFLNTERGRGLGVFLVENQTFQLGASLWFRNGRSHNDGLTVTNLRAAIVCEFHAMAVCIGSQLLQRHSRQQGLDARHERRVAIRTERAGSRITRTDRHIRQSPVHGHVVRGFQR
jgi:hypothetical protein